MRHKGEFKYEELSRQCDIPAVTIKARVAKGMSIEEAIQDVDLRQRNGSVSRHKWNGHVGVPAISKALGVSKATVFDHLKKCDGDMDKAAKSIQNRFKPERASPKDKLGLWSTALGLPSND